MNIRCSVSAAIISDEQPRSAGWQLFPEASRDINYLKRRAENRKRIYGTFDVNDTIVYTGLIFLSNFAVAFLYLQIL